MNARIAKLRDYQEMKAQKQIEIIEERQQILREKQQEEMDIELKRRRRAESLKVKLTKF